MTRQNRILFYALNTLFDLMVVLTLLSLITGGDDLHSLVLIAAAGTICFAFPLPLFLKSGTVNGKLLFLCFPAAFLAIHLIGGLSPLFALLLATLFVWRAVEAWSEPIKSDTEAGLAIALAAALIGSPFLSAGSGSAMLFCVLITVFLFFVLRLSRNWLHMDRSLVKKEAGLVSAAGALALSLGALLTVYKTVFAGAISALFIGVYYALIYPLYMLLSNLPFIKNWFDGSSDKIKQKLGQNAQEEQPLHVYESAVDTKDLQMVLWVAAVAALILIGIYLYKKRFNLNASIALSAAGNAGDVPNRIHGTGQKRRWLKSKSEIRRQLASFEMKCYKLGLERLPGESVRTWLSRLGFIDENTEHMQELYEKIRYGGSIETSEEKKVFKAALKTLNQKLTERQP